MSSRELLHWAGSTFEAGGGEVVPGQMRPGGMDAAIRAVHLLGRDGGQLFSDDPAQLAMWCLGCDANALTPPSWTAAGVWAEAAADLAWLQKVGNSASRADEMLSAGRDIAERGRAAAAKVAPGTFAGSYAASTAAAVPKQPPASGSESVMPRCPIAAAPPRAPYAPYVCDGESYEPRLLLRWLEDSGNSSHPSSGLLLHDRRTVMLELRATVAQVGVDEAAQEFEAGARRAAAGHGRGRLFWMALVFAPAVLSQLLLPDHPTLPAALTAYATCVPAVACLQLPFYRSWRTWVEGDVGMPAWVHRAAGATECLIVFLRMLAHSPAFAMVIVTWLDGGGNGGSGGMLAAVAAAAAAAAADGECCSAIAHVLTCAIMGGAAATWPLLARDPVGVVPAILLLTASFGGRGGGLLGWPNLPPPQSTATALSSWAATPGARRLVIVTATLSFFGGFVLACALGWWHVRLKKRKDD